MTTWARPMTPFEMLGVVAFENLESMQGTTRRWRVTLSAGWSFQAIVEEDEAAGAGEFVLLARLVAARVRVGAPHCIPARHGEEVH